MKMKRLVLSLIVLWTICLASHVSALPIFARKYQTTCFTCHVSPPLLNDFGERFRSNGFQLPGARSDRTPIQDQGLLPLTFTTQPQVAHTQTIDNLLDKTILKKTAVSPIDISLFSSAILGAHLSYFSEIGIGLEQTGASLAVASAFMLYTDVLGTGAGELNFRAGKIHLSLPFSHTSLLSGSGPLIYGDQPLRGTVTPKGGLHYAHQLLGAAAYGMFPEFLEGMHWEVAVTASTDPEVDLKDARGLFGSVKQALDIGAMRAEAGGFFYGGKQQLVREGYLNYPRANEKYRVGLSLSLLDPWVHRLRLYGQYVHGTDDNVDYWGKNRTLDGGFLGLEATLAPEKLYAFTRYDLVNADDGVASRAKQIDLGLRFHLLQNVVLNGGYIMKTTTFGAGGSSSSGGGGGGHTHSIVPLGARVEDADDEPPPPAPAVTQPSASDLSTNSLYLGILLTY